MTAFTAEILPSQYWALLFCPGAMAGRGEKTCPSVGETIRLDSPERVGNCRTRNEIII